MAPQRSEVIHRESNHPVDFGLSAPLDHVTYPTSLPSPSRPPAPPRPSHRYELSKLIEIVEADNGQCYRYVFNGVSYHGPNEPAPPSQSPAKAVSPTQVNPYSYGPSNTRYAPQHPPMNASLGMAPNLYDMTKMTGVDTSQGAYGPVPVPIPPFMSSVPTRQFPNNQSGQAKGSHGRVRTGSDFGEPYYSGEFEEQNRVLPQGGFDNFSSYL